MLISEMEEVELYQISDSVSGELELYNNPSQQLRNDSVYVLLVNPIKKIFLWIGQTATVRTRFIATNAAQNLQRVKGLTHRVISIDQGDEPPEFVEAITTQILSKQFDQ